MKKKHISAIAGSILVLGLMTACGENQGSTATTTATPDVSSEVGTSAEVETPTEMQTETLTETLETAEVTATPTEEAAPTEEGVAPTESADPNVIDGLDFNKYYAGEESLEKAMKNATYDSARVLALDTTFGSKRRVEAILADGDKFTCQNDLPDHSLKIYDFAIYLPKDGKVTPTTSGDVIQGFGTHVKQDENGNSYNSMNYFYLPAEPLDSELEVSFKIEYEDGGEETITVYLTKDFETFTF